MTEIYIENDSYNWFDRLDEMENAIRDICKQEDKIELIASKVKEFFSKKGYSLSESIEENQKFRYVFYDKDKEESLVFTLEPEMNLYYLGLAIHNELITDLSTYSTQDNPHEFFSMFLD